MPGEETSRPCVLSFGPIANARRVKRLLQVALFPAYKALSETTWMDGRHAPKESSDLLNIWNS